MLARDLFGVTYSFEELHIYKWNNSFPCWTLFGSFPLNSENNFYRIIDDLGVGSWDINHIEFHYNVISIYF